MNKVAEKLTQPLDLRMQSLTGLAMREFIDRVVQIPGLTVQVYGGSSPSDQSVTVGVSSLLSDEARSVIRLQGELYRKYPGASVRVDVTESDVAATQTDFSLLINS